VLGELDRPLAKLVGRELVEFFRAGGHRPQL